MGGRIPQPVKIEVISKWLRGYSRDEIAKDSGIGTGTVSGIILQCRRDDADFDLLRAVAVELRDRGLQVKDYAPLFRLKSLLDEKEVQLEIPASTNLFFEYEKFEAIIIVLEVLCFKCEMPVDQFFRLVRDLYLQVNELGISVETLPEYIEEQREEIRRLQSETKKEVERQGATMNILRDYQDNKPAIEAAAGGLEMVTRERDLCRRELDYVREEYRELFWAQKAEKYEWYGPEKEVNRAEMELSSGHRADHYLSRIRNPGLKKIILDAYSNPGKYAESIRKLIDVYDSLHRQSPSNDKEKQFKSE